MRLGRAGKKQRDDLPIPILNLDSDLDLNLSFSPSTIHFSPFTAALLPLFRALALSLALSADWQRDFPLLGSGKDGNIGEEMEEGGGGEMKAVMAAAADDDKGWGDGFLQPRDGCVAAAVVGCQQDVGMGQLGNQLG